MTQLNKIQIKAEILTVLSRMQANLEGVDVDNELEVLLEQEDKKAILDILIRELTHSNEQKTVVVCFLLLKLCEPKEMEDSLWGVLKNQSVSDSTKAIILNVLKDLGNKVEYEKLEEYFENPEDVVDADTKRLLQTAIINPEAQIDFMDFLSSLSDGDQKILVESLGEDYSSDSLANILNPIIMYTPTSDLGKTSIDILGETKSQLALHSLSEALRFVEDDETTALVKRNISKLKLAGVREDNAQEFYKSLLQSRPYFSYASFPDGHGNQAIIFSRERQDDESVQMFAFVVNDKYGIIDCFGFNQITKPEFERIVFRFYNNDDHIYINPSVIKSILLDAERATRKNGVKLSYEYICWRTILSDFDPEPVPIELILKGKYEDKPLSERGLKDVLMLDFVQKWFFDTDYNPEFSELVSALNDKFKNDNFDVNFESIVKENLEKMFTTEQKSLLDKRILMSAYLMYLSEGRPNAHEEAQLLYSLYLDEEKKLKLAENIIRKSLYEYYVSLRFKYKEASKTTNIFTMRNKQKEFELTSNQVEKVISIIEDLWVKD